MEKHESAGLKTIGDARDYLLSVMDYADDNISEGNKSLSKEDVWNLFIGATIGKNQEDPIDEYLYKNIIKEFPLHLLTIKKF